MLNKNERPVISVVTPSYNQGMFIEETIKSVLSQEIDNLEYVVIDGGSSDNTVEILKKYHNKLKWISEPDRGQSNAINKGFDLCSGKILCWLNSDDVFMPGALKKVLEYFDQHPEVDCVYGDMIVIDQLGNHLIKRPEIQFDYNTLLYALNYIPQSSTFWRRKVFEKVGKIDEELHYTMDHEYWLRFSRKGFTIKHINEYLSYYRWHLNSKGVINSRKITQERAAIRKKYANLPKHYQIERFFYPLLKNAYRIKRKSIKLFKYRSVEILPAHFLLWYLKKVNKHFSNGM